MSNIDVPHTLKALAFKNQYLASQFHHPDDIVGSQAAGKEYLSSIFPNWMTPGDMSKEFKFPRTSHDEEVEQLVSNLVTRFNLGMLLIRPEMYHHSGVVLDFLSGNNFKIRYVCNRSVEKEAYAVMYGDVFSRPPAIPSLPTRTMVYLNSPSMLVLFSDPRRRFHNKPLADGFCDKYKGKEGIPDSKTVRGSVVYPEAIRLGFNTLISEVLKLALDPLTALRHIVASSDGNQPHSHLPPNKSLLKYNAVSVHIPDSSEIIRDICVLNSREQLGEIVYAVSR